jgi:hypothetical protein
MSGRRGAVMTSGNVVSPDFGPAREKTDTSGRAAMVIVILEMSKYCTTMYAYLQLLHSPVEPQKVLAKR